MCDVLNMASYSWSYSGHRTTMSRIRPEEKIDVRNMASDVRNTASDVRITASDVRNMASDVRNRAKKPGHIPDIEHRCPEYGQENLAVFRTSHIDVRNTARFSWLCSGHRITMSGIWPGKAGSIPDIAQRCPEYGQEILALFRTSHNDVRNMARKRWLYSGHQLAMSGT